MSAWWYSFTPHPDNPTTMVIGFCGRAESRHAVYLEYLGSPDWRAKRALVLDRARGCCEGCGERRATEVHHLTYEHVGDEFLWELRAVCRDCHRRCHPEKMEKARS